MSKDLIKLTENFVKESFRKSPHFSFNDWRVMYNHSLKVKDIALEIAKTIKSDKTLIAIGALLHDIGKTKRASKNQLHYNHEDFNLERSQPLLNKLALDARQLKKLQNIISYNSRGIEQKIIKDADALALYADKKLYNLYIKWAIKEKLDKSIQRKLDKFKNLNFGSSRTIGEKWFQQMKKNWQKHLNK